MIELLVKYIQDKGDKVDVYPGRLVISRTIEDQICCVGWAIPKYDLTPDLEEILYYEAHKHMNMIDQAIAERFSCAIGGKR